jgi:hypothetical protein
LCHTRCPHKHLHCASTPSSAQEFGLQNKHSIDWNSPVRWSLRSTGSSTHSYAKIHGEGVNLLAVQLFERLPERLIITAPWVVEAFSTTMPTANRAIQALERAGVLVETTGKLRDRIYAYKSYLDRLRTGTELGTQTGA